MKMHLNFTPHNNGKPVSMKLSGRNATVSSIKCILCYLEIALLHLDANVTGHDHGTWHGRSAASHDMSLSPSP
jgi:hypothetical protein